jgi:hypothetical protein
MDQADYFERPMFGCLAAYLRGRLVLVLATGDEPWNGLLMPTEKEYHASLLQDFIGTVQHPVLKKWLYLPETAEDFEPVATGIVEAVLNNDPRLGVEPKERPEKKNTTKNKKNRERIEQ